MPSSNAIIRKLQDLLSPAIISQEKFYPTYSIPVDGIKLNYAKAGVGRPLVFVHGWTNNWEGWAIIIPYLSRKYSVYLVDLPGFGDSGDLPEFSVPEAARCIALFLEKLPQKCEALIGMSMGSFVVAYAAAKYPRTMKRSVLVAPVVKKVSQRPFALIIYGFLKLIKSSDTAMRLLKNVESLRLMAYFLAKFVTMHNFNRKIVDKYGIIGKRKMRKQAFVDMGISASRINMMGLLAKVKIPTLLLIGNKDKIISPSFVRSEILPKNKNLTLAEVPFAGHAVQWEKTEQVALLIQTFLNGSNNTR